MPPTPDSKLKPTLQPVKRGAAALVPEEAAPAAAKSVPVAQGDRMPSGIEGLDEILGGGFERMSTNLVMGGAGCGKTTFAAQCLYNGITQYDEPGVLLSFEETGESVLRHMKKYGFDFKPLIEKESFATINYRPHEVRKLVEEGGGLILDTLTSLGAKRLAIDPITPYLMLFETGYQAREAEITLFELFRKWKCTTVITSEWDSVRSKSPDGVEYLADSVILLHHPRTKTSRYRALEVVKMRGGRALEKICPFELVEGVGVRVYPKETVFYDLGWGE